MLSGYRVKQPWEIRKMQLSINVYLCYLSLAMWLIYILNKLNSLCIFLKEARRKESNWWV